MPYDILEDEAPATPGGYEILGDEPAETPGTLEGIANSFKRGNLGAQRAIEGLQVTPGAVVPRMPLVARQKGFTQAMEDPAYMFGLMDAQDDPAKQAKIESLLGPKARFQTGVIDPKREFQTATTGQIADLTKQANAIPSSAAMQEWSKADNSNWWQVFARNPVEITANIFAESIPQAATGMAAGMAAGAAGGPVAAGVGAGVGSFTVEAANAFLEAAANSGVNLEDPEQVRAFFSDEAKVKEAKRFAMQRGFPIALFDGLTAGVAGKFLKPALGKGMARVAGASAKELGTQMAGGALGETAAQVASGQDISAKDIAAEAIGELATAPGEVFSNLRSEARGFEVLPEDGNSQNSEKPKEPVAPVATVPAGPVAPVADTSADALAELQAVLRGEAPGSQRLKGALPKVQPEPAGAVSSEPVVVEKRVEVPAALTEEQRAAVEFQRKTDEAVKAAVQNPDKNYEGMSKFELELLEGMGDARATAALRRMRARRNANVEVESAKVAKTASESGRPVSASAPEYHYASPESKAWWEKLDELNDEVKSKSGTPEVREARKRREDHSDLAYTQEGRQRGLSRRRIDINNPLAQVNATASIVDTMGQADLTGWKFSGETGVQEGRKWRRVVSDDGSMGMVVWDETLHPLERAALEKNASNSISADGLAAAMQAQAIPLEKPESRPLTEKPKSPTPKPPTAAAVAREGARTNRRDAETQREKTPDAQEWEQLLKPDIRRDLRDEGVTAENVEALLSGKKTAAQVVDEQLGLSKSGGSIDATTMMVEENVDGSRSIGFAPPAGPASTTPVNVGQMSHVDAILMARDQGIERIQAIFGNRQTTSPPVDLEAAMQAQAKPANVLPKHKLSKPISGTTGAKIIGYEWRSTMGEKWNQREGGYVDARVSDWDNADESKGTGRQIVHVYFVEHPDGRVTTEGIRSAQNVLGISESRLQTIAKKAQAEQAYAAEQDRLHFESLEKTSEGTPGEASKLYRKLNWSQLRTDEENERIFNKARLYEKNGRFVRTSTSEDRMRGAGWQPYVSGSQPAPQAKPAKPAKPPTAAAVAREQAKEFDRLVLENGMQAGWVTSPESLYDDSVNVKTGHGTGSIKAKILRSKELARARKQAAAVIGAQDVDLSDTAARGALAARLKEWVAANVTGPARQNDDFSQSIEKGAVGVPVSELKVGDTLNIEGEPVRVVEVSADGEVTLQDGTRFGRQVLQDGSTIYAEEWQSLAEEGADSFPTLEDISESLKKPEPDQTAVEQGGTKPVAPTLKSGQRQGDLLGSGDIPFNLFAEQTQSGERIEAERQQREETQRAAKAFEEKNQQELPAVDSRIRDDLPEAKPVLEEIDRIVAMAEARHAEMSPGQTKDLTHPNDLLTSEEKGKLHDLKLKLRPKSAQEAKADILKRRAARKAGKDSIESALDAAIEATDFKPRQVNEGVTGAPVWLTRAVANGALRIVRAAYRGAKSLAKAIADAVEFLRAQNLPDFNEQEAQAWLESKFQPGVRDELAALTAQMDAIKARGEEIPADMLEQYKELVDTLGDEIRSGRANSGAGRIAVDRNLEENAGGESGAARRAIPQWKGAERLPGGRLKDLFTGLRAWRVKSGNWLARRGARESIVVNRDVADNRANQAANAASLRVRLILNRAFDTKPGQVRVKHEVREAALTFVVEADGERSRLSDFYDQIGASEHADTKAGRQALAALEYAEANWDKLQPAAAEYKTLTETEREAELNEGVNSPEWKGGYVKHSWARDDVGAGADPTKPAAAGTPFRKPRSVATYAEGIAQGRKPTTLNALELLADRVAGGQRKLNELAWVHGLRNLMDPATDMPVVVDVIKKPRKPVNLPAEDSERAQAQDEAGITYKPDWVTIAPEGYTVWRFGELEVAVQENFVGLLNKLTAASILKGSAVKKVFGFIKSSLLMFDTFHLGRMVAWRQMFGLGGGYQKGQTLLDFSAADIREMAARGEIPEAWVDGLQENKRRIDLAIRTGFNVGNVLDNAWGDALHNLPVVGTFNHWLFGQYQRGAMTEAWLIEFERMSRALPNASEEQVARRVSKDLNARFGNLNRQGWIKSRTYQDMARLVFLAPQWNESLIRAELGAIVQTLKTPMESIQQRRLVVGTLMKATGAMALGTFLANQILNYAFRGKPTWENEEEGWDKKISAYIPDAISGGPGFFLNPLALPMEYTHLIEGNLHRSGGDLSEALRRVAVSRLHAAARPIEIFANRRDPLGAKLRDGEVLPAMAKALIPIPIGAVAPATAAKQLISGEPSERFPGQYQKQMMASFGVKTDQAPTAEQRIRNLAREFNREKGIVPSAEFFTGDFDELNKALRIGNNTEARKALDELLLKKTPRQVFDHYKRAAAAPFTGQQAREREFWRGLTEEQRSQYLKALEARKATAKKAAEMLKAVAKPAAPI